MIKIECKGYIRKPETKTSKGGKVYNQFGVSTKTGKDQQGQPIYTWLNCRDFAEGAALPPDGAFVTLKGGMNVSVTEKDGKRFTNLDVFVDSLDIAPPRDGATEAAAPAPAKDPWE